MRKTHCEFNDVSLNAGTMRDGLRLEGRCLAARNHMTAAQSSKCQGALRRQGMNRFETAPNASRGAFLVIRMFCRLYAGVT